MPNTRSRSPATNNLVWFYFDQTGARANFQVKDNCFGKVRTKLYERARQRRDARPRQRNC